MSHFVVVLKIEAALLAAPEGNVEEVVAKMMAPYQENNMGDCPGEFMEFTDVEEESLKEYEEGTVTMVELANGEHKFTTDEMFRVPGTFGISRDSHKMPDDAKEVEVPYKEHYGSFDAFMKDYHGHKERDEKTGKYGYWENPNAKWDWYAIGGRWTGYFPVKEGCPIFLGKRGTFGSPPDPGHGDVVLLEDIDFEKVDRATRKAADKFWIEWQAFLGGTKFEPFNGPREKAMSIGLLEVRQGPPLAGEEDRCISWAGMVQDDRAKWNDVYKVITKETFDRDYTDCFGSIAAYAALDSGGWKEPGEMGWFGMSGATPESTLKYKKGFLGWIKDSQPNTTFVAIDCHI